MKNSIITILAVTTIFSCINSYACAEIKDVNKLATKTTLVLDQKDTIKLASNVISDTAVTSAVKLKITNDSDVSVFDIHVTTKKGVVTLDGIVPDASSRDRVKELTKSVEGVKLIVSNLKIDPTHSKKTSTVGNVISDSAITTDIKSKFLVDDKVSALNIHVETVNGVVTLTGKVPSKEIEDRAISIIHDVKGAKSVISNLEIRQ